MIVPTSELVRLVDHEATASLVFVHGGGKSGEEHAEASGRDVGGEERRPVPFYTPTRGRLAKVRR